MQPHLLMLETLQISYVIYMPQANFQKLIFVSLDFCFKSYCMSQYTVVYVCTCYVTYAVYRYICRIQINFDFDFTLRLLKYKGINILKIYWILSYLYIIQLAAF